MMRNDNYNMKDANSLLFLLNIGLVKPNCVRDIYLIPIFK